MADSASNCSCNSSSGRSSRRKISGPLLDRVDLHIEVLVVPLDDMASRPGGDSSVTIRARIVAAHERQLARQGQPNAQLSTPEIYKHGQSDSAGRQVLKHSVSRSGLSACGYVTACSRSRAR
jgi:magnesium chelatase family protein